MCDTCGPQPLDEQPVAETRGGNRLSDITVPEFAAGGLVPRGEDPLPEDEDE